MTAVHEKVGMPLSEFIRLSNDELFELINGERIPRLPTVTRHNETIYKLLMMLNMAVEPNNLGIVRPEATYVLPDRYNSNWVSGSRTPDLMFITAERLATYREANANWRDTPYLIVPDMVIEIISPTDEYTKVNEKADAYLSDGVRLIVLIDPQQRKAVVYSPDAEQPLHLAGDARIDFGDVIPDFDISLPALFE